MLLACRIGPEALLKGMNRWDRMMTSKFPEGTQSSKGSRNYVLETRRVIM